MTDTDLVVVGTYLSLFEAAVIRSALEAAGIESMIKTDDCGGMRPHLWMGGVQLLVRREDADQATEVIGGQAVPPDDEGRDGAA